MSTLTAIIDKLRSISPELEDVVAVLQVVQSATKIGGAAATTGLAVVASALDALEHSAAGHITHEQLMQQLQQSHEDLRADRAAEDARLAGRFPEG